MPGLTLDIKFKSQLHQLIIDAVRDRVQFSKRKNESRRNKWIKSEEAALAFLPETAVDAKRRGLRDTGKPQYTTIQIPYSYAVLMASHTYWTTVFMSRTPVLQFAGRHGESEQQVQAMEALIDYQVQVGRMLVPFYIWLLDGGKYGVGVVGTYWEKRESTIAEIVEEEELLLGAIPTGRMKKRKVTNRVPGYVGNRLYNVRPFDFHPDPRVPLWRFQDGEFCAVYNELGWNEMLRRRDQGMYIADTLKLLKPGQRGTVGEREAGSAQLELPDTDEFFTSNTRDKKASDIVKIYECYIELIPKNWNLGRGSSPEKWVFTVTSDFTFVLGAQPLGAWHDSFPFHVIEFEPEGYSIVNRGIPEVLDPIQRTLDWLINSHLYNVRKAVNDQFVVDPSKIVMKDFQDPLPGGAIRLKPSAYGTDVRTVLTQLNVVDITQNHMRDLQAILELGQRTLGVSDQILGLLGAKGGRKTATEVRSSTAFGINRLKTVAEYFSAMGWTPMSTMLVQNSQQYFDTDRKFRVVGDLALEAGQSFVNVTPGDIQGFFDFVPVDGTLPIDRFAQANLWRELLAQMAKTPEVLAQYDLGRIFAWVAQIAGLKNINQFKIQVQPDALLAQQAQRGNVVPGPGAQRDLTRVPEPGQISGLGTT
ncbi:MAG: hypothetical protein ACE5HV_00145 [Acidobacteriota bacterium]